MSELEGRWEAVCKLSVNKQDRLEAALQQVLFQFKTPFYIYGNTFILGVDNQFIFTTDELICTQGLTPVVFVFIRLRNLMALSTHSWSALLRQREHWNMVWYLRRRKLCLPSANSTRLVILTDTITLCRNVAFFHLAPREVRGQGLVQKNSLVLIRIQLFTQGQLKPSSPSWRTKTLTMKLLRCLSDLFTRLLNKLWWRVNCMIVVLSFFCVCMCVRANDFIQIHTSKALAYSTCVFLDETEVLFFYFLCSP